MIKISYINNITTLTKFFITRLYYKMGQASSTIDNNQNVNHEQLTDKQLDDNLMKIFKSSRTTRTDNSTQLVTPFGDTVTSTVNVDTIQNEQAGGSLSKVSIIPKRQRFNQNGGDDAIAQPASSAPVSIPKPSQVKPDTQLSNNDLDFIKNILYQTREKVDKFGLQSVEYMKKAATPVVSAINNTIENFSATSPEPPVNNSASLQTPVQAVSSNTLNGGQMSTINRIKMLLNNSKSQTGGQDVSTNVLSDDGLDNIRANLARQGVVGSKGQTGGAPDPDLVVYKDKILNNQRGGDASSSSDDDSGSGSFDSDDSGLDLSDSESDESSASEQEGGSHKSSSSSSISESSESSEQEGGSHKSSSSSSTSESSDGELSDSEKMSSSSTTTDSSESSSVSSDYDDIDDGHVVIMRNSINKHKNTSKYLKHNGYRSTTNDSSRLRNLYSSETVSDNVNYVRNRTR